MMRTGPDADGAAPANVGRPAPELDAMTHSGQRVRLSDFRGHHPVVLYFYPADGTAICTQQACSFRDAYDDFTDAGAVVIGVSANSLDEHRQFAQQRKLPFLLVSDSDGSIARAYGVSRLFGVLPGRVTFVIDRNGIVRMKFRSLLRAAGHVSRALAMVRQLARESTGAAQ
ncbi:MAG TPA: peroxiredoxin [Pirellulales bacterium]|jgi:peroxiredoxin Q/BCP|nr:peroxiredoxin [Pirellulales bacterium]